MVDGKAYPMLEVARHSSAKDCWMVINGDVYDVTSFLEEHPGGEDIMVDSSGRDATREFEDVGHSGEARAQLAELLVGSLREPTEEEIAIAAEEAANDPALDKASAVTDSSVVSVIAKWMLPIVIVGIAYLIRKYTA
jgi:cytochrome b5